MIKWFDKLVLLIDEINKKIIEKVQYVRNEQILEMKENRLITVDKLT